jgi:hypothetical protein
MYAAVVDVEEVGHYMFRGDVGVQFQVSVSFGRHSLGPATAERLSAPKEKFSMKLVCLRSCELFRHRSWPTISGGMSDRRRCYMHIAHIAGGSDLSCLLGANNDRV